ncbi:MAG: biotin carboxylase N-terminal domain-containing protein [Rhodoferax sp.]
MNFTKILIANRGEIACRVIRTARRLGYRTVAVYSDADRTAPHVRLADEAVHIGASAAADSYLRVESLLEAARKTGADAVHPGYGFLSENADFAQACLDAGLLFIGPPPTAMRAMGNKALAKRRMLAAGVPCAPGYLGEEQDDARLAQEASRLGFPLLVKAVAGGGGRGMRLVREEGEIAQALIGARREAQSAFGDGTLMLERLIEQGRHIEIQIFADEHGNAVHLGERDCTAQRRRQKVIEEAPSPVVNAAMRAAMGRDAVAAALAVGYRGAGTVEFMVDADLKHYFLEMNTRLQVEHPVTEMVTGFDLVEWQLMVASGLPLPATQAEIRLSGHAIEARLYVEDPYAGFAPQTGTVCWWRPQQARPEGVRIDDGIDEGSDISPFYDPMVAKVIVHGRDRDDAIRRLRAALENAPLLGLRNNGRFLADLVDHPAFRGAAMTTGMIDQWQEHGEALLQRPVPGDQIWCLAAAVFAMQNGGNWRADSVAAFDIPLQCDDLVQTLRVHPDRLGQVTVTLAGQPRRLKIVDFHDGALRFEVDGVTRRAVAVLLQQRLHIAVAGASFVFAEISPFPGKSQLADATRARSPVAGRITQIKVAVGDQVGEGQALLCVEAMKMEMWLTAQVAGTVAAVHATLGEQVESGVLLVEIELEDKKEA